MLEGYAKAFTTIKLGKLPAVGDTKESSPVGEPCIASMPLLVDCCPFPGEVLAGLQPAGLFLVDMQIIRCAGIWTRIGLMFCYSGLATKQCVCIRTAHLPSLKSWYRGRKHAQGTGREQKLASALIAYTPAFPCRSLNSATHPCKDGKYDIWLVGADLLPMDSREGAGLGAALASGLGLSAGGGL